MKKPKLHFNPPLLRQNFRLSLHVALVAVPLGILVGCAVAGYDYLVIDVLWNRFARTIPLPYLCFLPVIGMLLTGAIMISFRVTSASMADEVVRAYHNPEAGIDYKKALPKLGASLATMGFGGSAGMEGASKWLGGTIASFLQLRLNRVPWLKAAHGKVETTMLAGAAAGIGAIFRAPLTGAIMGIESPYKQDLAHDALVHALVASAVSYATYSQLRDATPYFPISFHYTIELHDLVMCIPLGLLAGAASHLFLGTLEQVRRLNNRWPAPRLVKYAVGGLLVSLIAYVTYLLSGEAATLQSGLPVADRLLNHQYTLGICILFFVGKILATALTFGMGGVGGLFLPSATMGAALGAACDILLHPTQPGLFTLVGIAAFTGATYNGLLFAAVFVAEATGSPALVVPGLLASCVAFLVSAGFSNSPSQKMGREEHH